MDFALSASLDFVLINLHMPELNGWEATEAFNAGGFSGKVWVLSMRDDEAAAIRAVRAGASGFLVKDVSSDELDLAIREVYEKGFFHSDFVSSRLARALTQRQDGETSESSLTDREREFLRLSCTELTYKEIADEMCVSPRTVDGYGDAFFEKVNARSRVGPVLLAVKRGWARL